MTTGFDEENHAGPESESNVPEFSVTELSQLLKRRIEEDFSHIRLRAEISGFKRAASGHLYFTLKDDDALLDGVCWRTTASKLSIDPEDGMEIIATGRITTYPARSKYQMVVERMELAGEGALLKLLEDRRRKLAAEGLFDEDRKQPIPYLPRVIGIVSSPTGAVIRDILHRLRERFPCHVLLWPVLVQGDGAADQVARAIRGFDALPSDGDVPRPDLVIVARGGGSLEDLMAFNEERVVRAAAECRIPLISAVGHETDWTLIDYAADQRAPTPTAAAEMAVPVRLELLAGVMESGQRLSNAITRRLSSETNNLAGLSRGLPNLKAEIQAASQRVDDWGERLDHSLKTGQASRQASLARLSDGLRPPKAMILAARQQLGGEDRALQRSWQQFIKQAESKLDRVQGLLESYSYERVLDRGFALVRDGAGQPVLSAKTLKVGDAMTVQLRDGDIQAIAAAKGKSAGKPLQKKSTKKAKSQNQGSLFE